LRVTFLIQPSGTLPKPLGVGFPAGVQFGTGHRPAKNRHLYILPAFAVTAARLRGGKRNRADRYATEHDERDD